MNDQEQPIIDIVTLDEQIKEEEEETNEVLPETLQEIEQPTLPPTAVTAAAATNAAFKTTSVALVEKLLQFSTPRIDSKIVNVLFLEGMMDIFMTHVSRLDTTQPTIELKKCTLQQQLEYSLHARDTADMKALKRSYHAMEFLSGTTANHLWVQNTKFYDIILHLLEMFLPNSHGNFNHFFKIFQHLVRRHPCEVLGVIMQDDASILFHSMMPYLNISSVMDSILSVVFVRDIKPEVRAEREKCHHKLQELGFLEWIIKATEMKDYPEFADASQELFLRIIEEASQVENGDTLLNSLRTDTGIEMIETLVKGIVDSPPSFKRDKMISIVKSLVKSGMLTTRASSLSQTVQGPLYFVSLRSQELLVKHISQFCQLFIKDRQSNINTKIAPLTTSDMDLLDIIYQTLHNAHDKTQMLASIPSAFWKILVDSFFGKPCSNIYHTLFYRIVYLVLSINYEPTLIVLVRKQALITRLIDEYENRSRITEIRGFTLLILNQLRLMADAHHSDLISRILLTHPRYLSFLPTLRKDTLAQTKPIYTWKLEACPRPPAHLGPTPPIQTIHFSPYAGTLALMSNTTNGGSGGGIEEKVSFGIDLGSDFAYCLGFKESAKGTETPYGYLSRRNSNHSDMSSQHSEHGFPMDIIWGESLTASTGSSPSSSTDEEGSSKSISKKKKKKKGMHYG